MKVLQGFKFEARMVLIKQGGCLELLAFNVNLPDIAVDEAGLNLSDWSFDKVGEKLPIYQFSPPLLGLGAEVYYIDGVDESVEQVIVISLYAIFVVLKFLKVSGYVFDLLPVIR